MTLRTARSIFAAIIVPAAVVACLTTSPRVGGGPALIVSYPAGLTELRLDGSKPRLLLSASNGVAPRLPAVSPDGTRIAYLLGPPPGTPAADSGADVWVADRAGTHRRRLLSHPQPNHSFRQVAWQDDRHLLVVVDVPARCDGCNPATTTQQRLRAAMLSDFSCLSVNLENYYNCSRLPRWCGGARLQFLALSPFPGQDRPLQTRD